MAYNWKGPGYLCTKLFGDSYHPAKYYHAETAPITANVVQTDTISQVVTTTTKEEVSDDRYGKIANVVAGAIGMAITMCKLDTLPKVNISTGVEVDNSITTPQLDIDVKLRIPKE